MTKEKKIIFIVILVSLIIGLSIIIGVLFYNRMDSKKPFESESQIKNISLEDAKQYLKENWDNFKIDGTVQMEPLHNFLNDKFSANPVKVEHNAINKNFDGFLSGDSDILLGVIFDEEETKMAREKGIDIKNSVITKEALVFYVDNNNSLNNLSLEQIKDIYTGKKDNWSSVGGNDLPIVAFQRFDMYSSQKILEKIIKNNKLIEKNYAEKSWPDTLHIANFGFTYDDTIGSIGFDTYTFSHKNNLSGIKNISIDGILPNDKNIFDNTYPLIDYNYLYYNGNDSKVSEFCDNLMVFLDSEEGQKLINNAGYISVQSSSDRNKTITINDEDSLMGEVKIYDESTKKFYSRNEKYHLQNYNTFSDFVLRDTEYKNNQNAKEFLNKLQDNNFIITKLDCDQEDKYAETGKLNLGNFWCSPSADTEKIFNFQYNGFYYSNLIYNLENDEITLMPANKTWVDNYLKGGYLDGFPVDKIAKSSIKIDMQSLNNVQYREQTGYVEGFNEITYVNFKF